MVFQKSKSGINNAKKRQFFHKKTKLLSPKLAFKCQTPTFGLYETEPLGTELLNQPKNYKLFNSHKIQVKNISLITQKFAFFTLALTLKIHTLS